MTVLKTDRPSLWKRVVAAVMAAEEAMNFDGVAILTDKVARLERRVALLEDITGADGQATETAARPAQR